MTTTTATFSNAAEPAILASNTYFWTPARSADQRRRNEVRNTDKVANYLSAIGFTITDQAERYVTAVKDEVNVTFYYEETCSNVYKSLSVTRAGKVSNITAIRKIAKAL